MPRLHILNAVSLDGHTTGFDVDLGEFYGIARSLGESATLAGCDTLLAATPTESETQPPVTEMSTDDTRPLLVVVDSKGRLKNWPYWTSQPMWRSHISLCSEATRREHIDYLRENDVEPVIFGDDRVDLTACLENLEQEHGVDIVRLESGGRLNAACLAAGLVHEIHLLVHPVIVGSGNPDVFVDGLTLRNPLGFQLQKVEQRDNGIILVSYSAE
jgi:2,5-diamino-6-(ribosylamino)-4(3H)-pyrimidinone 5'-phosphate reductase